MCWYHLKALEVAAAARSRLRLEVAVQHAVVVAVGDAAQQLVEEGLEHAHLQAALAHVQVLLEVLCAR
jgi:sorbitol-specific phosphotransferase system component IIA